MRVTAGVISDNKVLAPKYVGWRMKLTAMMRSYDIELDSAGGPSSHDAFECWKAGLHPHEAFVDLTGICLGWAVQ